MYYEFVKVMLLKNKISQNGIVWNGFYYFMYLGLCSVVLPWPLPVVVGLLGLCPIVILKPSGKTLRSLIFQNSFSFITFACSKPSLEGIGYIYILIYEHISSPYIGCLFLNCSSLFY